MGFSQRHAAARLEDWHPSGHRPPFQGNLSRMDDASTKHRVIVMDPAGTLKLSFGSQRLFGGSGVIPTASP